MTAQAMQEAGRLQKYITSFFFRSNAMWGKTIGSIPALRRRMLRRYSPGLDQDRIQCVPQYALIGKCLDCTVFRKQISNRRVYWVDRAFDSTVARRFVTDDTACFIGYPNACLRSFEAVKERGGKAILDLPIGHFRKAVAILEEEKRLHPEFADSITYSSFDDTYAHRVDREMALADYILVPSQFVKGTLTEFGVSEDKIVQIPYGSWLTPADELDISVPSKGESLRIIYFGQITQRKGIKYLLEAIKTIRNQGMDLQVTLVGGLFGGCGWMKKYADCYTYLGSLPRTELRDVLLRHDVFVLPTLFEGSAYVIPEALSHALPVITTENAGAESIQDGHNGFIVPIRDSDSIAACLSALEDDRGRLRQMKLAALASSRSVTWDRYRDCLREWFTRLK